MKTTQRRSALALASVSLASAVVPIVAMACRHAPDWTDASFRRDYLAERRRSRYSLEGLQATPEAAALAVARELAERGKPSSSVFSEDEFVNKYWPNLPDIYTNQVHLPPESALEAFRSLRDLTIASEAAAFSGRKWTQATIGYRRPPEVFGSFVAHYPEYVLFRSEDGVEIHTQFINVLVEHHGKFKVARLAPL